MMKKSKKPQWKIEETYKNLYKKALNYLSYGERTVDQMKVALDRYMGKFDLTHDEKESIKEGIISELSPKYLLDESTYVKEYILSVIRSKRCVSGKQISLFLSNKGISGEVIERGLENYYTEEVEEEMVRNLCDKKVTGFGFKEKSKLVRYLIAKGFSPGIVYTVVDTKFKR